MCIYEVDSLKIEKEKAMIRYLRFKNIGSIFRTLEFVFAILFFFWSISRSSPYISAVLQIFGVFVRRLSALVVNHHFVFLLGNGIIVTLFVKFCQFACDNQNANDEGNSSADDGYQIGEVDAVSPYDVASFVRPLQAVTAPEEKRIIPAEKVIAENSVFVKRELSDVKRYRRSHSNVFYRKKTETIQLRRSETEPRRNSISESAPTRRKFEVDDLSNEEFRKKVDSIIEQHRRSLREESMFIVSA